MAELVTLDEILTARQRIAGVATKTGLYHLVPDRLRAAGIPTLLFALYVKAESEQPIGSFKLRGAYNRIAQLSPAELGRGVITYSSGNHAQGVAYAARALGAKAVIVMPSNAPAIKLEATRALGAEIVLVGPASSERRVKAEALAATHGYTIIPPYDDPAIVAGQATCGLEILEQLDLIRSASNSVISTGEDALSYGSGDTYRTPFPAATTLILSPVSGGGLLSGVATAVKLSFPNAAGMQVWGVEPELAADAKESFDTRTLIEWPAAKTTRTLSDGLRTQSLGTLNFAHVLRFVDGIVTVSEDEVLAAMRVYLAATDLIPEPSGAVTLAAALFHHAELPPCRTLVAILSGGNLEPALHAKLVETAGVPTPSQSYRVGGEVDNPTADIPIGSV